MALPLILTALLVYRSSHPLIRVGADNDGGYVIADLNGVVKYDHLVSGGIGSEAQGGTLFESHLLNLNPGLTCDVYDHTVDVQPLDPRIVWHKQPVGGPGGNNLHSYLNKYRNLFVKIDIEEAEFAWLSNVSDVQLSHIAQLTIEWHHVHKFTMFHWEILRRISVTHKLIHVHACNCGWCGFADVQGVKVPHIFEATYVRRDLEPSTTLSTEPIPSSLDGRNVLEKPELAINWPPFVNPVTEQG